MGDPRSEAFAAADTLRVRQLGQREFGPVWRAMEAFTDARTEHSGDEVWLVQHDPVFTLGQAGRHEHVLDPRDIPLVQTNRGGQVTYHGPGQIVAYPLIDLRRRGLGVRDFVCRIEQGIIDTLAHWNIVALRRANAPGVYVAGAKVGALGLRVRRGCTFHGLALNVAMDLEPFRRINPCGYQGLQVTQVSDLGGPSSLAAVETELVRQLAHQLGLELSFPEPHLPVTAAGPANGANVSLPA